MDEMNLRTKKWLTSGLALLGFFGVGIGAALALPSATTTYTVNVTGPSVGLTISQGSSTLSIFSDKINVGTSTDTISIKNTGTSSGSVFAKVGNVTGGSLFLIKTTLTDLKMSPPGFLAVEFNSSSQTGWTPQNPANDLPLGAIDSLVGTINSGTTASATLKFGVSPNTAGGSYTVPINWTIQ
jgi:hypothetical protein